MSKHGLCGEDFMESVEIKLDIEDIDDPLYYALLEAFRNEAAKRGLDPECNLHFDEWKVSCVARKEDCEDYDRVSEADLRILEMHHNGLDAEGIAEELRLPIATVKEVIKAWTNGEYKTR